MKKTNKPNPLKVFNDNKAMAYKKAGGEMAAYKKSLKKFQGEGDSEVNMMINKPGSTGGYQKSRSIFAPPAGMNIPSIAEQMASQSPTRNVELANQATNANQGLQGRAASLKKMSDLNAIQGQAARASDNQFSTFNNNYPQWKMTNEGGLLPAKQKRGGAVKTKKRK
jgi:hypothetical protein